MARKDDIATGYKEAAKMKTLAEMEKYWRILQEHARKYRSGEWFILSADQTARTAERIENAAFGAECAVMDRRESAMISVSSILEGIAK